ncbi:MAG TPA: metallophosphoesterase [Steroidobacteraceae bacterium]|nr:metallophosphoesterase [Steroidobacteraceae bacterium]
MRIPTPRFVAFVAFVALLISGPIAAAMPDGPYVLRDAAGKLVAWSVEVQGDVATKRVTPVKRSVTVKMGTYPDFLVTIRAPAAVAPDAVTVPPGSAMFVVADTHGEFEILAQMLVSQKIVDAKLRWSFGRGHLIVLGDVFDRGPNHLEILWLLYSLEAQATKAGGGVHLVLGNHETMALRGDGRYLNPRYVETAHVLDVPYEDLFRGDSVLGQWLRSKPVVLKVNDLLCLHGGISRALVDRGYGLADINRTVRQVLNDQVPAADADRADFLMTTLGPLWYRGYFAAATDFTGATDTDVDLTLQHFGVKHVLVGHTIVPTVTPLFGGKVIAVQVYPKREEGHVSFESLLIRDGKFLRAQPDGTTQPLEMPAP